MYKKTIKYGRYTGAMAVLWWIEVHAFKWMFILYMKAFFAFCRFSLFVPNIAGKAIDKLIWVTAKLFKKEYELNIAEKILGFPYRIYDRAARWCKSIWNGEISDDENQEDEYENNYKDEESKPYWMLKEPEPIVEYVDDRRYARGRAYTPYRYGNSECKGIEDSQYDEDERIDIDKMDGGTFEHFCADLLRVNGWTDVQVTPGSGDHGIDITADKDDIKWGFQCKRWNGTKVDAIAIGQTFKGKALYECDMVAVITTSTLTAQAEGEAKQLGIKVWGRGKIRQLMSKLDNADDYYLSA